MGERYLRKTATIKAKFQVFQHFEHRSGVSDTIPTKGGLRPLQNDSGVTLLRTRAKTAQFALSKEGAGTGTSSGSGVKSPNDGELSMERGAGANEGKFLFWNLWYPVLVP